MAEDGSDAQLGTAFGVLGRLSVEQLRCHRIDPDLRRVVGLAPDGLVAGWAETNDEVWIDIQAPHPNDIRAFLEQLDLHSLILEDCLEPQRSPRFSS